MSRKKKILIGILTPVTALVLAFVILCIVTMSMYSPRFLGRVLVHWDSGVTDYEIFPERTVRKSDSPYTYKKNLIPETSDLSKTLNNFIGNTDTTSFIVVKNDEMIFEKYFDGYGENSVNTSFSMAKSVVSLLVGKALEKGFIKSVNDPISNYIAEFENIPIGKTTIEELLLMRSDIVYNEDKFLWFGDDTLTYWYDDLRKLALTHTDLTDEYGGKFHYNNYHPLLLGIILERSCGVSVSQFFETEIWQPIGAEYDASWSLDGEKSAFEKMESGINFRAADFLKIGSAVLHGGYWNGRQIISSDWIDLSAIGELPIVSSEYEGTFLDGKNLGYKYMWYYTPSAKGENDIIAWGKSDQILYISPATDTVILRTGKTDGGISNWAEELKKLTIEIGKQP